MSVFVWSVVVAIARIKAKELLTPHSAARVG